MRILVVDDEDKIRSIIKMYFSREGYDITEAVNGKHALDILEREKFDLIILDIMMPELDGWAVCRQVRSMSKVPIIMLTARGEEVDRVVGLEMGADDYVVKPFSPRELLARVKAVLRRLERAGVQDEKDPDVLSFNNSIEINTYTRSVNICGHPVQLTAREFELLVYMARHPGRVFTRDNLLEGVWGYDYGGDTRTVDTHVNRLRDKLNKVPDCPDIIRTVWGVGYKFEVVK